MKNAPGWRQNILNSITEMYTFIICHAADYGGVLVDHYVVTIDRSINLLSTTADSKLTVVKNEVTRIPHHEQTTNYFSGIQLHLGKSTFSCWHNFNPISSSARIRSPGESTPSPPFSSAHRAFWYTPRMGSIFPQRVDPRQLNLVGYPCPHSFNDGNQIRFRRTKTSAICRIRALSTQWMPVLPMRALGRRSHQSNLGLLPRNQASANIASRRPLFFCWEAK